MARELEKNYDPLQFEDKLYQLWEKNGYFHAKPDPGKQPYTIVIPPPNITGQLHMGHALDNTLQDILIRYKRMSGFCALWLPGTDHASIATEARIVEAMKKEGLTKEGVGREKFLERAWAWKEQYGGRIIEQLKKMGSSCDWSRTRFTMDEGCSEAVKEVFIRLYGKGLIYRGERIINWCPHCLTSISDAEVEYEDQKGRFWHLRYPLSDGSGFIELATTRPETMLGDTAVAVNPKDKRYQKLIGKTVILPLVGREIPIVADEYVDPEFGTGAVKITPAHDPNDFEVGRRHGLPLVNVMTPDAKITADYPNYAGMDRYEARKAIVRDLEEQGFLVRTEEHDHNVGTCYRCTTTVEPRASLQWFVKMEPLAKPAIEAVKSGEIKFVPERFDKTYFHWMENIRDWCISRQLWWGHRIPAFYCDACGETVVTKDENPVCPKCGELMRQDPDTLDTWFSSALWPFSTLGWPENTADLNYFYPTNTLVTGYDIITFWVSRMIFSGLEYTGEKPFDTVLIHGLVRDAQGRKMSKSLGNGIDPLEVIEKYGADALRFALATGNSPGNDMRFSDEKIEASRNFCNKLWNAARFILMNLKTDIAPDSLPKTLAPEDKWILTRYTRTAREVGDLLDRFEIGMALGKLYDFIWDEFCDWFIELSKDRLYEGGDPAENAARVLCYVMGNTLKLLHPFLPFITEEIWQALPHDGDTIMRALYPNYDASLDFGEEADMVETVMAAVKAIRNRRAEMNVAPSRKAVVHIDSAHIAKYLDCKRFFVRLASCADVVEGTTDGISIVTDDAKMTIPTAELVDVEAEKARLKKELEAARKELEQIEAKLSNSAFVDRAPPAVVEEQRLRREKLLSRVEVIRKTELELR